MEKFCNRLREALNNAGITQMALAERLGINRTAITHYLQGQSAPNQPEKLLPIARILGVNAAWLAGFDVPKDNLTLTSREIALLVEFGKLNDRGKDKAEEYITDLTEQPKYTAQPAEDKKMA